MSGNEVRLTNGQPWTRQQFLDHFFEPSASGSPKSTELRFARRIPILILNVIPITPSSRYRARSQESTTILIVRVLDTKFNTVTHSPAAGPDDFTPPFRMLS